MGYFYVLPSLEDPDWFYKGSTTDLKCRISQHKNGEIASTRIYLPLRLVYCEMYMNEDAARQRESLVKNNGHVWVPFEKAKTKDNLSYKIEGYVDAENGFGAKLRTHLICSMTVHPETKGCDTDCSIDQ